MKKKTTTVLVLVAAVTLVISVAAVANAAGRSTHKLTEIPIEADFHHLGNDAGAEGVSWQSTFSVPQRQFDTAGSAHLALYLLGSGGGEDSVTINGQSFALPESGFVSAADVPFVSKVLVSLPLAFLQPGSNTIVFSAGQLGPNPGTNTHDDFEFGEVVLLLSS